MSYLESLFSLEGKTAVVIGGTGVLCGEMARAMAKAGAEVVLVGRDPDKANAHLEAIEKAGGRAYFVAADISTSEGVESLLAAVLERSGRCDILVNGAGVNSATPFLETPQEELELLCEMLVRAYAPCISCSPHYTKVHFI